MTHIWLTPTQDRKISQKQEVGAFQLHFGRLFENPSLLLEITLSPPLPFSKCKLTPARETLKQTVCYKCGSDSRSHLIEDCFIIARCLTETWSYSIYR